MNCADVRAVLPLLIYGEANAEEPVLREHLAHCAACRREWQALENMRGLLDGVDVPRVTVDVPRLYRSLTERQMRRARRWRRIAVVLGGLAALLLLALGFHWEVRLEAHQLVLRWGVPPGGTGVPPGGTGVPPGGTGVPPVVHGDRRDAGPTVPAETEEELRVLRELIHVLKQDGDDREQRFQEGLERLQQHVQALQARGDLRWTTTEQNVTALYLLTRKGEEP